MSKADKFREMPADFVKLFNRYIEEVLHEPAAPIEQKALPVWACVINLFLLYLV